MDLIVQGLHLIPVKETTELLNVIEESIQQLPQTESTTRLQQQLKEKEASIHRNLGSLSIADWTTKALQILWW